MCPGKASSAVNGGSPIDKGDNAAWAHLGGSLRASRKGAIHRVASLGKGPTLPSKTRLVANPFLARCIHQYKLDGVLAIAAVITIHSLAQFLAGFEVRYILARQGNRFTRFRIPPDAWRPKMQ